MYDTYQRSNNLALVGIFAAVSAVIILVAMTIMRTGSDARCEGMRWESVTSFQTAPSAGTFAAFDSQNKPCAFNAQKDAWEPLVYVAPPAQPPQAPTPTNP